jgi:hypothetical protein
MDDMNRKALGDLNSGDLRRADRARRCSVTMMRVFIGVHFILVSDLNTSASAPASLAMLMPLHRRKKRLKY